MIFTANNTCINVFVLEGCQVRISWYLRGVFTKCLHVYQYEVNFNQKLSAVNIITAEKSYSLSEILKLHFYSIIITSFSELTIWHTPVYLSVHSSVCLFLSGCIMSIGLFCVSFCSRVPVSLCLSFCLSACFCLSSRLFVCLFMFVHVCLSVCRLNIPVVVWWQKYWSHYNQTQVFLFVSSFLSVNNHAAEILYIQSIHYIRDSDISITSVEGRWSQTPGISHIDKRFLRI